MDCTSKWHTSSRVPVPVNAYQSAEADDSTSCAQGQSSRGMSSWQDHLTAAASGDDELAAQLVAHAGQLDAAARDGQKPLLDALKAAGVAKMGVRQRLAKALREKLADIAEPPAAAPTPPSDFWASLIDVSESSMDAGVDFKAPVALDASQYGATATPRERAAIARTLPPAEPLMSMQSPVVEQTTGGGNGGGGNGGGGNGGGGNGGGGNGGGTTLEHEQLSAYRERGNVAFGRSDYGAAERWYGKAVALATEIAAKVAKAGGSGGGADVELLEDHAAALSNLAACALNKEPSDPAGAMLHLRTLLAASPSHVKGRLRAGRSCVLLGLLREAETHYEVVYRLEKPKIGAEGLQLRYTAPADDRDERRGLLKGPDGKSLLSDAARQAADGKALAVRIISHGERCRSLAAAGRVDEALYLARSVCRSCSHSSVGQLLLVGALEGSGRLWEAQQEAEEAYATFPNDEALGVMLARVFARRGKTSEAEYTLLALVRSAAPGDDTRAARALRGMRAALAQKADGNAHYKAGDFERAAAAYSEALEADVEGCLKPTLLANRAQARLQDVRVAEALADCDEAIRLDAGNAKLLLRRAACHVALKQPAKAKLDYEAVLKLDPSCEAAREYVEKATHAEKRRAARGEYGGGSGGGGEEEDDEAEEEEEEVDPYAELGLAHDANAADIKTAYRKLALKWHPDKHHEDSVEAQAEAEARFQALNLAHAVLTDPVKRRQYDAGGRVKDIMR